MGVAYVGVGYFIHDVAMEMIDDTSFVRQESPLFQMGYKLRAISAISVRYCVAVGLLSCLTNSTSKTLPFICAAASIYQVYLIKRKHDLTPAREVWLLAAMNCASIAAFIIYDLVPLWRLCALTAVILVLALGVAIVRDNPKSLAGWDTAVGLAGASALFGIIVLPVIKQEFGGGDVKSVHLRFVDQTQRQREGYDSSIVLGKIVHASESTIYIVVGREIRFIKREHVISMTGTAIDR